MVSGEFVHAVDAVPAEVGPRLDATAAQEAHRQGARLLPEAVGPGSHEDAAAAVREEHGAVLPGPRLRPDRDVPELLRRLGRLRVGGRQAPGAGHEGQRQEDE